MTKPLQTKFKRIETKFIITEELYAQLLEDFKPYLQADDYAHSTITNVYFDNLDFQMIQDSIARLNGREKIRVRTYDAQPHDDSEVFLEIKKKDGEVGYKYRTTSTARQVLEFITTGRADHELDDEQLAVEMPRLIERYGTIQPMMYISYSRYSLKGIEDSKVRVTFDSDLLYRTENVSLTDGFYGHHLVDEGHMIMEIKVPGSYPDWMAAILDKHVLVNQSFSKYGTAFRKTMAEKGVIIP